MPVNGIQVCLETFGERTDPPLLLLAGEASSMDWWDDEFCRRLAAGGRFVIRYDHRDTGRSTSFPAGAGYSGADLMNDALGVLDALGVPAAHLVGLSLGGALAQRIAVEQPHRVLTLTLIATSAGLGPDAVPVLAGVTAVAVRTAPATEVRLRAPADEIDWSDRRTAVAGLIAEIRSRGGPFTPDEPQLRRLAERVFDRSANLATARLNHRLAGFGPPVRDRLPAVTAPTLILHGTLDQRFPPEHPRELARVIPGSRLVWLEGVGHEVPPRAVWNQVLTEILGEPADPLTPAA
ncbi:pimeloyl-ACP methyl ester carboxylesterase [Actinoplanes teichomyceticus]|uniref:Pimeloyl-ACP methyl ester carboxylesterase n=2 Tax=Actinoplanes teichomyceticus TaxID=1867 RepID=A0A561WLH7_ACTTI|nr:pimeloyl-ACP methyl ester carboxylesterase [Actinoplanes teichomyceticus]